MAVVTTAVIAGSLKETLESIVDDDPEGAMSNLMILKVLDESTMKDNYQDDLEYGGPGLLVEKDEATEVQAGNIKEGYLTRYMSRTFALKVIVSDEAMEDKKYDEVINAQKRLMRAAGKTVETDGALIFVRGWNTSYPGGDGLPLFSASHTLPQGGTFSNTMAVPQSPSVAAVITATTQMRKMPGHDGIIQGYEPECVVCPVDQWAAWDVVLHSTHKPEAGEFNAINVVNYSLDIDVYPLKFWTNSTTNWCMKTNADNGLKWLWKRRPKGRAWVDNDFEVKKTSVSYRSSRGWSDARCAVGSQA
jgi:hypothetical protein